MDGVAELRFRDPAPLRTNVRRGNHSRKSGWEPRHTHDRGRCKQTITHDRGRCQAPRSARPTRIQRRSSGTWKLQAQPWHHAVQAGRGHFRAGRSSRRGADRADRIAHPVPAKASQGRTKTRLALDPAIAQVFAWRVVHKLGIPAIAAMLNAEREQLQAQLDTLAAAISRPPTHPCWTNSR